MVKKLKVLNAGYPMAALAGALGTTFEKIDHYNLGDVDTELTEEHVYSAINMMKLTSIYLWVYNDSYDCNSFLLWMVDTCLKKLAQFFHF